MALLCLLPGCTGGDAAPDPFAVAATCSSGASLDPDYQPSPEMSPGRACIACHVEGNAAAGEEDAPVFGFAGTAFPTAHEPDFCEGAAAAGAVIELVDARGETLTAEANSTGNFFAEASGFSTPYTARVRFQGRTRAMLVPQSDGDCNRCHTSAGDQGAPGRILLP